MIYYIVCPLAYILFGIAWGFLRWKRFVDDEVEFYEKERQRFLNFHRVRGAEIPGFLVFEWRNHVQGSERLRNVPPKAHDYQVQIAFDAAFWPISFSFVVLSQVVSMVMRVVVSEYNKITQQKVDRIRKDLKG